MRVRWILSPSQLIAGLRRWSCVVILTKILSLTEAQLAGYTHTTGIRHLVLVSCSSAALTVSNRHMHVGSDLSGSITQHRLLCIYPIRSHLQACLMALNRCGDNPLPSPPLPPRQAATAASVRPLGLHCIADKPLHAPKAVADA